MYRQVMQDKACYVIGLIISCVAAFLSMIRIPPCEEPSRIPPGMADLHCGY